MSSFKIYYPDSKDILQEGETLPDGRRHGKSYKYYQNGKIKSDSKWRMQGYKSFERAKHRSKTFKGVAQAMAEQWSEYLERGTK